LEPAAAPLAPADAVATGAELRRRVSEQVRARA